MSTTLIPSYNLYRGNALAMPFRFLTLERTTDGYNSSEPHRHSYYEIFYFVHGAGIHDLDFHHHPIRDHSIHFVTPGQVHQIRRSPESHGYILLFTPEFYALGQNGMDRLVPLPCLGYDVPAPVLYPSEEERKPFLEIIAQMQDEFESDRPLREDMLRSYLNIFLVYARRMFEAMGTDMAETQSARDLVHRLRELIEQHFSTQHAPNAYAKMLGVSLNHLNTTIRKALGKTIGDMVHDRLVLEAKRLLFNTDLSVKEIAFRLNYEDPSYFTRFFKRHTGVAPLEFRETSQGKHH